MEEIWKDVVGWEGLYQVSSIGHVRSLDRIVFGKHTRRCKGQLLTLRYDKDGYLTVHCRNITNGKNAMLKVHRMVADAFIPKRDLFRDKIDHINGKRDDNRVGNLRWCTNQENNNFPLAKVNRSKAITESYNKYTNLRKQRGIVFSKVRKGVYQKRK